jgi:O-antigen ligase
MFADNLALSSPGTHLLTLPKRQQILLGAAAVVMLLGSLFMTHSLIPLGIILGGFLAYAVIRNPVWSIFAFIVINVILSLSPKQYIEGNAPSLLDISMGVILVGITIYWTVRLKFFERQNLSQSIGQLSMALFMIWSLIVTVVGIAVYHWNVNDAAREILNLSPLFILPVLYSQSIQPDSKNEFHLLFVIIVSAIIVSVWNILHVRNSLMTVVYLFETERGSVNATLPALVALIITSRLMSKQSWLEFLVSIIILFASAVSVVVSFSRGLYIATLVSAALVMILGNSDERRRGIAKLLALVSAGVLIMIPVYQHFRLFRLLLDHYAFRFFTSTHVGTDLSLLNRYSEYKYAWKATLASPFVGSGFGARFRTFNIIGHQHQWAGFSHNSYLYIAFKTGIPGIALFIIAYIAFAWMGFQLLQQQTPSGLSRVVLRAFLGYLVLIAINATVAPIFDSKTEMVWVGIAWGFILTRSPKLFDAYKFRTLRSLYL